MKILHTSDWHFGQHFMGKSRQREHEELIAWLLRTVDELSIDAVLIAGDIFDTGAPPSYARELYHRVIVGLYEQRVALVVLGGNHDSVATLQESQPLLAHLNTSVVPGASEAIADEVVVLRTREGAPGAIVCAVPFLRARDVMGSVAGQSAEEKQAQLMQSIETHYAEVYAAAVQKQVELGWQVPIIATGHLTTVGATMTESVREIYVGSLSAFPARGFPPVDYVALGHIHRPQQVMPHIRYSGSPIALSFDELSHEKQMCLVTFDSSHAPTITAVKVPCFQPMLSVKGDLPTVEQEIRKAAAGASVELPVWVEVEIVADDYLNDLQSRLQALIEGLPVEILRVKRARAGQVQGIRMEVQETLAELSPLDVFQRRLGQEVLDDAMLGRLTDCYQQIVHELQEPTV